MTLAPGLCAISTATFLAFDYCDLYYLVLIKMIKRKKRYSAPHYSMQIFLQIKIEEDWQFSAVTL